MAEARDSGARRMAQTAIDRIAALPAGAPVDHNHDGDYALLGHYHDERYALLAHNHDGTYAPAGHNHDGVYAAVAHNHDGVYAPAAHDHDAVYALVAHTHAVADVTGLQLALDGKAASGHNHDGVYALSAHNHDGVYAPAAHTHVKADIADLQTLAADAYTPTATAVTNCSAITVGPCWYTRVGSVVTVSGEITLTCTAAGVVRAELTLPIAATFANGKSASGTCGSSRGNGLVWSNSATGNLVIEPTAASGGGTSVRFVATYSV